jgi:hypothetical protein
MPFEQFQAIQGPLMSGLSGQQATQLAEQQQGYDIKKLQEAARLNKQNRGGGGQSQDGNAYANYVASMYGQPQQPQQSTGQAVATGITQGTTLGIVNRR